MKRAQPIKARSALRGQRAHSHAVCKRHAPAGHFVGQGLWCEFVLAGLVLLPLARCLPGVVSVVRNIVQIKVEHQA